MANRSSPIKRRKRRKRRTKAQMDSIRAAMYELLLAEQPMTVRQVFYRLVSTGVIDKTEREYKSTVCRLLTNMRRSHVIPYEWITDATRWMRKPRTHSSLKSFLRDNALFYRRSVWDELDVYVEVWCEKDAVAGILYEETAKWDVPLMVTRGYPSLSFLHSAGEAISETDKPTHIYYFGDHDPSGVHISKKLNQQLHEFADGAELYFERVAVTEDQIQWGLPTRPTKKTDSRSKNFKGDSIEVDAIPPDWLRGLVRESIEQHVPPGHLEHLAIVEAEERKSLAMFADQVGGSN